MELKENERGIYLFFPTDSAQLQASVEEIVKLEGLTSLYGARDLYLKIWPALIKLTDMLRTAQDKENYTLQSNAITEG